MTHIVEPLAFIHITIRICHASVSLSFIIFPLTLINLSSIPLLNATSITFICNPLSLIISTIFKNVFRSIFSNFVVFWFYIVPVKRFYRKKSILVFQNSRWIIIFLIWIFNRWIKIRFEIAHFSNFRVLRLLKVQYTLISYRRILIIAIQFISTTIWQYRTYFSIFFIISLVNWIIITVHSLFASSVLVWVFSIFELLFASFGFVGIKHHHEAFLVIVLINSRFNIIKWRLHRIFLVNLINGFLIFKHSIYSTTSFILF